MNYPSTYRDATHFAHETWDIFAYRIWFTTDIPMLLANANFVLIKNIAISISKLCEPSMVLSR